jgi:hypothetical protein
MTSDRIQTPHKHRMARRPFSPAEDASLYGILMCSAARPQWRAVARQLPGRTARQCRERWLNYLSPTVRADPWTEAEDRDLLARVNEFGSAWSSIARFFSGRSDNDIKNRWYSHIRYHTFLRNGTYVFADQSTPGFEERRTRNRVKICPQRNAIRAWRQQAAAQPEEVHSEPKDIFDLIWPSGADENDDEFWALG